MKRRERIITLVGVFFTLLLFYYFGFALTYNQIDYDVLGNIGSFAQVAAMLFAGLGLIYIFKTYQNQKNFNNTQSAYIKNQEVESRFFKLMDVFLDERAKLIYKNTNGLQAITLLCKDIENGILSDEQKNRIFYVEYNYYIQIVVFILTTFNESYLENLYVIMSYDDLLFLFYYRRTLGVDDDFSKNIIKSGFFTKLLVDRNLIRDKMTVEDQKISSDLGIEPFDNLRNSNFGIHIF